jgi:4-hydroxy-tetrahydrodipicolinate reductase
MKENIRVVIQGLGKIGGLIAKGIIQKPGLELVGGIDVSPEIMGKDLGEVIGIGKNLGMRTSDDIEAVLSESKPDIVVVSTRSFVDMIYPDLVRIIKCKVDVISTCETLVYPYYRYPDLAKNIDELAKEYGVSVVGTGINPGFMLDALVMVLTAPCVEVKSVFAKRQLDLARRRYSLQKKSGLSLNPEEWKEKFKKKEITGHVGYAESAAFVAYTLGWRVNKIEEWQDPIVADKPLKTDFFDIQPGQVAGRSGGARALLKGEEVVRVEGVSAVNIPEYEEIVINGNPSVHWKNDGGTHGDLGTVGIFCNMIPRVINAPPGLLTMKDIALPTYLYNCRLAVKG